MIARWLAVATALALPFAPAIADAFLRLSDGRVLEGLSVRRDDDVYLLELPGDTVVPVPVSLVTEVGIRGARDEESAAAPTGLTLDQPRVLAGTEVRPTTPSEQLAVFGKPAQFQPNVVESTLGPTYWHPDPSQHNWAPSTWAQAPINSEWHPTSAFDPSENVMAAGESKFQNSIVDSSWTPTDGFAATRK